MRSRARPPRRARRHRPARIETCLAAMQATGHPAWAALSTSGLRALDLPKDVRDVIPPFDHARWRARPRCDSATAADGTLVEAYLRKRGLHLPTPPRLRFHAELKHHTGGSSAFDPHVPDSAQSSRCPPLVSVIEKRLASSRFGRSLAVARGAGRV